MTEQSFDEKGQPIDADGSLADPDTDRIVESVSKYFPTLVFDIHNVRASFDKVIDAEPDPKIKGLLMLIQGLYLARKQHAEELNIAFFRTHELGQELLRLVKNLNRAFTNLKGLYENDKTFMDLINELIDAIEEDSRKTKVAIRNLRKFRKRHEPKLKRLEKYIAENADKFKKMKEKLR